MKDITIATVAGGTIGALVAILITLSVKNATDERWRNELVKSGHAEYYVDASNERQWRLK